jgi:hypothetical protein
MKITGITVLLLLTAASAKTQHIKSYDPIKKGQFFVYWGWNREFYSKSDISLKGADYDIRLSNVKAKDKPTKISYYNYLHPGRVTIPQTNIRIGYFIKTGLAVSLGIDHMKYVMVQDQTVQTNGYIDRPGQYKKIYNGPTQMTEDFLTFEHTDGLNYIHASVERYRELYHSKTEKCIVNWYFGGGAGLLVPKTNVKFLDYERSDRFHVSGFGVNAMAGLQGVFFRHFIMRLETKGGYIDMPDIILHKKGVEGRGKQRFFFGEAFWSLGATYTLNKRVKKVK